MTLAYSWLSPDFATAGQIGPDDVAQAAAAGFRSIVNNRPDFEAGPSQPTSQAMRQAAEAAGLRYEFLPVQSGFQTPAEIARMYELLEALPKPVLGYCRSGARTSNLFRAAKALDRR
jgi:uncharacterized protein (TIGR01244 family)